MANKDESFKNMETLAAARVRSVSNSTPSLRR